jgi:WD40 repeat protein
MAKICQAERKRRRQANNKRRIILEAETSLGVTLPDLATVSPSLDTATPPSTLQNYIWGFTLDPTGENLYTVSEDDKVRKYPLGTAYDLSTVQTLDSASPAFTDDGFGNPQPRDAIWHPDGDKLYTGVYYNKEIRTDNLVTAFDVTDIDTREDALFDVWTGARVGGFWMHPDGEYFAIANHLNDGWMYKCPTPWDVQGAATFGTLKNDFHVQDTLGGIIFDDTGTRLWATGVTTDKIFQHTMTTPFDIGECVYDNASCDLGVLFPSGTGLRAIQWHNGQLFANNYDVTAGEEQVMSFTFA